MTIGELNVDQYEQRLMGIYAQLRETVCAYLPNPICACEVWLSRVGKSCALRGFWLRGFWFSRPHESDPRLEKRRKPRTRGALSRSPRLIKPVISRLEGEWNKTSQRT